MGAYEGFIATRGFSPSSLNTTNRMLMSRSPVYARDSITALKIAIGNWRIDSTAPFAEVGSGSAATVKASVEYPAGTFTQILFSGISSGTVGNIGTLFSDYVNVTIPNGALFWIRIYWVSTTGVFSLNQDISGTGTIGGGLEVGVSGITDKTMSGTVTAADNGFPPLAVIGMTTRPAPMIIGDSITLGLLDTVGNTSGDFGSICRSIGPSFAYCSMAQNGDRALSFLLSNTNRSLMLTYASHMIIGYGSNDLFGASRTGAQLLTDVKAIAALLTSKPNIGTSTRKVFPVTIMPRSTSTDLWATSGGNQTTVSGNIRRTDYNALIRAGNPEFAGYFELADVVESARDSGLWKAI